ncbi:Orotate phosphoribosyltransferase [Fulvia fulva]|nr:Orotate phosphoribosyltransferase [Fulvia fulva]WPV12226.1 Orotate phosphoribosyltransferase [Fulvia fulva]WPV28024.1 Orotate phosphoribosyltransferase [Fulvia fulva]
MSSSQLPDWKQSLIETTLSSGILTFGSFKLKSNRISPYFFNAGLFCEGHLTRSLSQAYAHALDNYSREHPDFSFDVIFGPAYKGIQLCATTAYALADIDEKYGRVGHTYNRKEVKDHGEGGLMVGKSLKGKKVVIIDDVITAGTAIREAISMIDAQGGTLAGIIVAIDRQEKMPSQAEKDGQPDDGTPSGSAIGEVRRETGVPVLAVLTLEDMINGLNQLGKQDEVARMQEYRQQYGASD